MFCVEVFSAPWNMLADKVIVFTGAFDYNDVRSF